MLAKIMHDASAVIWSPGCCLEWNSVLSYCDILLSDEYVITRINQRIACQSCAERSSLLFFSWKAGLYQQGRKCWHMESTWDTFLCFHKSSCTQFIYSHWHNPDISGCLWMCRAAAALLCPGFLKPHFFSCYHSDYLFLALGCSKSPSRAGWMLGSSLLKNDIKVMKSWSRAD